MFEKVELAYGLGLRAADADTRARFYTLWNKHIHPSLFERLRHVIVGQNWEEMGHTFWLKQAVVRNFSQALACFLFQTPASYLFQNQQAAVECTANCAHTKILSFYHTVRLTSQSWLVSCVHESPQVYRTNNACMSNSMSYRGHITEMYIMTCCAAGPVVGYSG